MDSAGLRAANDDGVSFLQPLRGELVELRASAMRATCGAAIELQLRVADM
jgi:hypothetical protein